MTEKPDSGNGVAGEAEASLPVSVDQLHAPAARFGAAGAQGARTVFIPGVLGSPSMWKQVASDTAMGPAIGLSLPGHFPWALDRAGTERALKDFAFLDAYRTTIEEETSGRIHLVAHSTGALAALKFAALHHDIIGKLTLVGAFSSGPEAMARTRMRRAVSIPYVGPWMFSSLYNFWTHSPANYLYGLSTAMGEAHEAAQSPAELAMLHDMRRSDPEALREVVLWLQQTSVEDDLKNVRAPVTVLVSQDDPVVDVSTQLALVSSLPNANAVLCRLGHLPMFEAPDLMRRLILSS